MTVAPLGAYILHVTTIMDTKERAVLLVWYYAKPFSQRRTVLELGLDVHTEFNNGDLTSTTRLIRPKISRQL
jgi:hypothetical protein